MVRIKRGLKPVNEYGYRGTQGPKHTYVPVKKFVRVTLYDGSKFDDRFLRKDGRFHIFSERGKVKSSNVYQLSILDANRLKENEDEH